MTQINKTQATTLLRLARTDTVRRYAAAHPHFRVVNSLPRYFVEMLVRLEREETGQKR